MLAAMVETLAMLAAKVRQVHLPVKAMSIDSVVWDLLNSRPMALLHQADMVPCHLQSSLAPVHQ
jgi:hypothetical protein